jgi:hypothetical protein
MSPSTKEAHLLKVKAEGACQAGLMSPSTKEPHLLKGKTGGLCQAGPMSPSTKEDHCDTSDGKKGKNKRLLELQTANP